jgi:nucleoside-diphosphate-sugar epimerase
VARVLIVGGGCRGLQLSERMGAEGHAVRIVTRSDRRRAEIESTGAECFLGDPNRLATLRMAVEHVTVVCWLLATASGERESLRQLHRSRLEQFLHSLIDSGVRGFLYELGRVPTNYAQDAPEQVRPDEEEGILACASKQMVRDTRRNAIPLRVLGSDPRRIDAWLAEAHSAVVSLL